MNRKVFAFVLAAAAAATIAVAIYTFMPRNRIDGNLMERLVVDDMTHSKAYGWVFAKHENYNGEFVLYIEGLHRVVFAVPAREETKITGNPDITIKMGKDLRVYGNIMVYSGKQYAILEYGSYALPPWASESLSTGDVRAFTSLGRELTGVEYEFFPILEAIALYRVTPISISPYANYFIDVAECLVYDNTVEYRLNGGIRVVFTADTMEFVYSSDAEIDRAFKEGDFDYYEYD